VPPKNEANDFAVLDAVVETVGGVVVVVVGGLNENDELLADELKPVNPPNFGGCSSSIFETEKN